MKRLDVVLPSVLPPAVAAVAYPPRALALEDGCVAKAMRATGRAGR